MYLFAFLVSLGAGLSTCIGGIIPFFTKKTNVKFLTFALGLSAGVMVYISFMEMLAHSMSSLENVYNSRTAGLLSLLFFFTGIAVIALIDKLVPEDENPHEFGHESKGLGKMGIMSALAIAIHNFPEGLASFMSALSDPVSGISIAVAVALHNIPEGITVSTPIYHESGSRMKAFMYTLISGLAEPLGALFGFLFLRSVFSDTTFALVYALVAGIMIYLAFDELLPAAENYGHHHLVIYSVIAGMFLMGITLALLS